MKILIVADNYYPNVNGSSYFTQRLAFYLKQRGHQILVMSASRSIRHEPFQHNDIDVYGIRSFSLSFIYKDFRFSLPIGIRSAIAAELKRFRPDVIHIQDHFVISPVVQKVAQELPTVTTPTHTAAQLLEEVKLTKPVLAVSNGIDLKKFRVSNNGDYLKARYHLPAKPTLLYVGRLDKEKNVDMILKALPAVLAETDMHFVIGGKGAEQDRLKILAKKLDIEKSVTFTGFVPDEDLPNLYKVADCFIIAGTAELQSLVTMEAMA